METMVKQNIIDIKPRQTELRVYSIVLSSGSTSTYGSKRMLWLGLSYTLEEAILRAKEMALRNYPEEGNSVMFWTPEMYLSAPVSQMMEEGIAVSRREVGGVPTISGFPKLERTKNDIMNQIIDTRDKALFKKHLKAFTKEERAFLRDSFKKHD